MFSNLFKKFQSESIDKTLTLGSIDDLHSRLNELSPNIMNNVSNYKNFQKINIEFTKNLNLTSVNLNMNLKSFINDFYQMTSIEKNSKIMNSCSKTINIKKNNFLKN